MVQESHGAARGAKFQGRCRPCRWSIRAPRAKAPPPVAIPWQAPRSPRGRRRVRGRLRPRTGEGVDQKTTPSESDPMSFNLPRLLVEGILVGARG